MTNEFVLFNSVMLSDALTEKKIEALKKANIPFRTEHKKDDTMGNYILVWIKNEYKRQANKSQKGLYLFQK